MQLPLRFQTSVAFITGLGSELVTPALRTGANGLSIQMLSKESRYICQVVSCNTPSSYMNEVFSTTFTVFGQ
jgi:hypothetical protein